MISKTKLMVYGAIIILALIALDVMRRRAQKDDAGADDQTMQALAQSDMQMKEFTSPTSNFKVMLPAVPQHASEAVPLPSGQGLIKYDMYLSQEKDGTTYMISLIQYPVNFSIPQPTELLDSVMREMMAGNANNQLKNMQKGTFQGFPSLDFEISNNQVYIRSKGFVSGKTLYVLTLIDRDIKEIEKQFDAFVSSFQMQTGADMPMTEMQDMSQPVPAQ